MREYLEEIRREAWEKEYRRQKRWEFPLMILGTIGMTVLLFAAWWVAPLL